MPKKKKISPFWSGTRFRWWIRLEAGSRWRIQACLWSFTFLSSNWCRTSVDHCCFERYYICHTRGIIHWVIVALLDVSQWIIIEILRRGMLLSTAIFVYAVTGPVNGYFGGSLYARMGGKLWIRQMVVSAFMLPVFVCGTAFCINFIAMYYHASRAIPFETMVSLYTGCQFCSLEVFLVFFRSLYWLFAYLWFYPWPWWVPY